MSPVNQMTKKEVTVQSYNKGAKVLSKKFNKIGQRIEDVKAGLSYVQKTNPKILELGCGNGRDAQIILQHSKKYLGIDISIEMIRLAEQNNPKGNFVVADIENFNSPQNIDIIFAFASLIHFNKESLKYIFNKSHDSLNSGGIIYISLKHGKYQEKVKEDEFGPRIFYTYEVDDIIKSAGDKFQLVMKDHQTKLGVEWFTVVLRKSEYN
jgi:SAM-dependent methyltransferase